MKFNEVDVRAFYQWLGHSKGELTEIRAIPWPTGPVIQKFVQTEEEFVEICKKHSGKKQVYVGLNPRKRQSGSKEDIARVVAVPFDVDAKRYNINATEKELEKLQKQSATEEELADAKKRMVNIVSWMRKQGFQQPFVSMSGNGFHVIQKVNLPKDGNLSDRLETYFHQVDNVVPEVTLDSIFDLPRIIKVPGTLSIKGTSTKDRPHRLSYIVSNGAKNIDNKLSKHIQKLEPYIATVNARALPITATLTKIEKIRTGSLKPCFKRFAEEGGVLSKVRSDDHLLRLALVVEAHFRKYNRNQIINLFRKSDDFNLKITNDKVNRQLGDIAVKGIKVWSCRAIHKHNGCLGEICSRYKKQITKYLPIHPPDPKQSALPEAFFDNDDRFVPTYLVDYIIQTTGEEYILTPTTEKGGDIIWRYHPNLGIFKPDGISYIEKTSKRLLGDKCHKNMISEVIKLTQIQTYIGREQFEEMPDIIVLKNGVYHIDTDEITEHSPQYHAKARIPITFNQNAECPTVLKFLSEVIPKDIATFQEWVGYHFTEGYKIAIILILIGDGENGKSKLLLLLNTFLGHENITNIELFELITDRFKKAELYGKLGNISPDIGSEELKYTGRLKSLSGDDYIEAAKKHQQPFRFRNRAKLSFSTNKLPITPDRSRAFFRRPLIVTCPNIFIAGDPNTDINILDKITTESELSGMFNWAIKGLQRIQKQGHFTRSETAEQKQELYEDLMDPISSFLNNCVNINDPTGIISKDNFHKFYYHYCKMKGFTTILKQTFSKEIKPRIIGLGDGKRKLETDRERELVWTGISMKPDLKSPTCPRCPCSNACISSRVILYKYKVKHKTLDTTDTLDGFINPSKNNSIKDVQPIDKKDFSHEIILEKIEEIKSWILDNKNKNGLISCSKLIKKIKESGLDPIDINEKLLHDGFFDYCSEMDMWVVKVD